MLITVMRIIFNIVLLNGSETDVKIETRLTDIIISTDSNVLSETCANQ